MTERSLGEVSALVKRAVRGAGYDWGVCEDCAAAACWLIGCGLEGIQVLAAFLSRGDAGNSTPGALRISNLQLISAENRNLNPLYAGTALTDHCHLIVENRAFTVTNLGSPLLTAGFIGAHGAASGRRYLVTWGEVTMIGGADGGLLQGEPVDLLTASTVKLICKRAAEEVPLPGSKPVSRPSINSDDWAFLEALAGRTYAPATDASRMSGAGPSEG